ncbi:membrane protein [Gluconacetobacter liquefaciens]|uniref:DUF1269 domain-containing protein n=1 Tax=Gluconacetobacter liquefaciens TaxID=89584 RepID=A0A370G012_GLULI|nr:DUF1269 domain-containing protein [Gluconacetobacter liquefaciens]MBB2187100.1 DUF1269 domain-containing protein [Gluconacetobacter liquefaciens]RDI37078.1 putative membrane protein [Gluconacetobacter liquefaciens]GBQ96744.1 hypothetical protein AA0522_0848 [Gluconacetobacter liquefaciens NRIC 0522]GEB37823.1 membrane protein [Gluconacetobacter liquefaciens]
MSDLVVLGFDTLDGATLAREEIWKLENEYLVDVDDAVVVRRTDDGKIHLDQSVHTVALGAVDGVWSGMLLGTLIGLVFLNPLAGFAVGAVAGGTAGTVGGALTDFGINDDFMKRIGATLKPGTSALFVLVRKVEPQKVVAHLRALSGHPHIVQTSLSPEAEQKLRAALAADNGSAA